MSLTTRHSLKYLRQWVRVNRPLLLRPHPPGVLVTPCPLLEKEDCHHEGADLREARVPCGGGHTPLQGLSLPGHLAPQRPSAAAQQEGLWLRLVRVLRLGGREPRGPRILVTPGHPGHPPRPSGSWSRQ